MVSNNESERGAWWQHPATTFRQIIISDKSVTKAALPQLGKVLRVHVEREETGARTISFRREDNDEDADEIAAKAEELLIDP